MFRATVKETFNKTKKIIDKLRNPKQACQKYADFATRSFVDRIYAGLDPYGRKQPELSPKYRKWKLQRSREPILVLSRKMINTYKAIPSNTGVVEVITSPIAAYHQYGTKNLKVRLLLPTGEKGLPVKHKTTLFTILKVFLEDI